MAEISFTIEVRCNECGTRLDSEHTSSRRDEFTVEVEPCPKCIRDAKEDAYDEGFTAGKDEGLEEGYNNGYDAGASFGAANPDVMALKVMGEQDGE